MVSTKVEASQQGLVGPGVEPGVAAPEPFDGEAVPAQVVQVDVGDLQFAAGGRLEVGGDVEHVVVVEVEPRHRVGRARRFGLLLEADGAPRGVELHDAVALWVADQVPEHRRARFPFGRAPQDLGQAVAEEDVVAERQRHVVAAHEVPPEDERLRQPIGAGLHRVLDRSPRCWPSRSSRLNPSWSSGVVMTRISRMPASISVDSG